MKNFIKTCLVAVALMIGSSAYAQLPVQFGVNAGVNLSNASVEDIDTKAKVGFQVGVTVDYNITQELFLQSGLSFTTKGAKTKSIDLGVVEIPELSINAMYLQLPVRIGYKIPATDAFSVNFNAGPYLAYGLGGKTTTSVLGQDLELDTFGDDNFKRFDFGLGFGVGAEFGKICVNLGYELGLANISKAESISDMGGFNLGGGSTKNRNAFLTVGYKF